MSDKNISTENQQIAIAHVQVRLEEVFHAVQQRLTQLKATSSPNQDSIAIAQIRLDTLAKLLGLLVVPLRETYERIERGDPLDLGVTKKQQDILIAAVLQGL